MPYSFAMGPTGLLRRPLAFLCLLLGLLAGCNNSDSDDQPAPPAPTIQLATSPALGSFLTDKDGNTLYYFARDVDGTNACSGGCAAVWPVFYTEDIRVSGDLQANDFKTQNTASGQPQTTYKGWPLYYYAPAVNGQNVREQPGQTTGNGIGNVWYVMEPAFSIQVATKSVVDKSTGQAAVRSFLVDSQGRTLYTFGKDTRSPSTQPTNCTGNCQTAWPTFYTASRVFPSALTATDFGTITRTTTTTAGPYGEATNQQLTYKGRPLYYFAADALTRGKVEGQGVTTSEGDQWQVALP
ncbi:hypothetical protein [Hymenobacter weizhouensis]|uniref:hypothetical protein n=1 Tax=Hymenobacter sp. YIM 151500-1 TaxID=2987689 RepID=UPI0022269E62|nr:hypothetical protein [Hymenobacter sp. YIM 151500-1]UYZ63029.1 hypothetical protein OIS53_18800 [Hymenobacter sp. YIM 151500-1]